MMRAMTSTSVDRVTPGPGQESVWDYPRPPRVERVPERIRVVVDGIEIADSTDAYRVLETAGAPVYYVPSKDIRMDLIRTNERRTVCEWKGEAAYHTLSLPTREIPNVAWSYPAPGDPGPPRVLRIEGRRGVGRRRARDPAAGPFLWWLGDVARGGPVQGWTRLGRLVSPSYSKRA
jgi:uncharacterized protein (DUF427 family)